MPRVSATKPQKPYAGFPLTPHANGQWCKKVKRKVHFFGTWGDADAALQKYLDERDDLQAGRIPRRLSATTLTVGDTVNLWLKRCDDLRAAGELQAVTFADYKRIGGVIVEHFGRNTDPDQLRPTDFAAFRLKVAAKYSQSVLSKMVVGCGMVFRWAFESEHLERMPRFGPDFSVATNRAKRIERASRGKKLLSLTEIRALLAVADSKWRALVLLAINGGLGNSDVSRLTLDQVGGEWLDCPRGKTGVGRKIPLWPETQSAISAYLKDRASPKAGMESLAFLSDHGGPILAVKDDGTRGDLIVTGFRRLAIKAGIHKTGMGFYWIRHCFQTVADASKDPVAVSSIMGHTDNSMAGVYREGIEDARLRAVTDHVRGWLFGAGEAVMTTGPGQEVPPVEKPLTPKPKPSRRK
jgi:integrase